MRYLDFLYGLAFFSMGLLLAFQARLSVGILSRPASRHLAGFGLLHGASEWTSIVFHPISDGVSLRLALAVLSYVLLMHFSIDVHGMSKPQPRWLKVVPTAVLAAWIFAIVALEIRYAGVSEARLRAIIDAATRYLFGPAAALLAAHALYALRRSRRNIGADTVGILLVGASCAFLLYAIVAGLVVAPAPFFPASVVNTQTFYAATGLQVEVVRAGCALALGWFLSEAFVIGSAREHREWERRREEFISVVAHDLQSPLNVIQLASQVLERGEGTDQRPSERILRATRTIGSSVTRLDRMIKDLLDASRIETHRMRLEPSDVDLVTLVGEVVRRSGELTEGHPVKTHLPDSSPRVHADSLRVEQVLDNLLSNAAKYSSAGTEIAVEAVVYPAEVEISVSNSGEGLTPEEAANVFSRFYRSETARRGRKEGLGLGLYIAKGLTEAQGGRMWVESEPGRRTTFRFTLPR